MRWLQMLVLAAVAAGFLAGCNTFKGMGKDIEGAGAVLQKAADKTKDAIERK